MTTYRPRATPPAALHPDPFMLLREHGEHSSAFLALNEGNEHFISADTAGMVTYRPHGRRYWVQFSEPVAADHDRARVQREFLDTAQRHGKRVIAVQLTAPAAQRSTTGTGGTVNQFGCSYSISLSDFTLRGQKFVKTRNMIARSRREGVAVGEVTSDDLTSDGDLARQLDDIDATWLRSKGRHVKAMEFLVGQRGGDAQKHRRLFVARHHGLVVAYISYSPVFGTQPGWLYDLTRRHPAAPPGVVEHIFADAALVFADEGAGWVHLGLTPFVGLGPDHAFTDHHSTLLGKSLDFVREHGDSLYPAKSQLSFKLKWRPHVATPEYVWFPKRLRVLDIWTLARITNSV